MMYLWFLLAGAFAGTCAGLFGVGGGLIIVPVLMAIFKAYGYPSDVITHLAVGTSLATIVVTSISSMQSHNKRGGVRWDVWRNMSIGLVVGSFVGAYIADLLHGKVLAFLIAGMALFMGLKMLKVLPYQLLWLLTHWLYPQSLQKSPHQPPLDASAFR